MKLLKSTIATLLVCVSATLILITFKYNASSEVLERVVADSKSLNREIEDVDSQLPKSPIIINKEPHTKAVVLTEGTDAKDSSTTSAKNSDADSKGTDTTKEGTTSATNPDSQKKGTTKKSTTSATNPDSKQKDKENTTTSAKNPPSLDKDVKKRGEWQQEQLKEYCKKHKFGNSLPADGMQYDHLLYDDGKKIIYCYVPKVGCSKWKYTFVLLNGVYPVKTRHERLPELQLMRCKRLSQVSAPERKKRLAEYFKFVIIRNPMERIVSAYLDKLAHSVNTTLLKSMFEERLKEEILKIFRPTEYKAWLDSDKKGPMYPTFSEYIQFLIMQNMKTVNEHFQPVIHMCHPCAYNFHFYGNFKLLPDEAENLLSHLNINSTLYYDRENSYISHKGHKTSDVVAKHFSELTEQQKKAIYHVYREELDFYYTLYPEERGSHKSL